MLRPAERKLHWVSPEVIGVTSEIKCRFMDTYRLVVKEKGRVVLPVALQRLCEFAPGDELVARPLGKGRFMVESADAILDRIWSQLPDGDADGDESSDLATWRAESDAARRSALESPELGSIANSDERASRLRAEFGL